jgi:hypothetical protein
MHEIKKTLIQSTSVDMLMIMDCTSSMGSWIERAADKLVNIIDEVKSKSGKHTIIKVAYVGYRDFYD